MLGYSHCVILRIKITIGPYPYDDLLLNHYQSTSGPTKTIAKSSQVFRK